MDLSAELLFGIVSLLSLLFAFYTYFKSREFILPLIEKLRASRNGLREVEIIAERIANVSHDEKTSEADKVAVMTQLAKSIKETTHTRMNTIDDGTNWGSMSAKQIFREIRK